MCSCDHFAPQEMAERGITVSKLLARLTDENHVWSQQLEKLVRAARGKFRLILWVLQNPELAGDPEHSTSLSELVVLIRSR